MGETIGLAQGAFVKGRQILDLVLIANGSVEEYRVNKKGVAFKIDFEKTIVVKNARLIEAQHMGFALHKAHPLPKGASFMRLGSRLQALKVRAFPK